MRRVVGLPFVVALALAVAGWPLIPAVAGGPGGGRQVPSAVGKAWRAAAAPRPSGPVLPVLSAGADAGSAAARAAAAQARRTGKRVLIGGLTTATSQVWVSPDGLRTVSERVLPVRVRRGKGWVPVDTHLIRDGQGGWSAVAVPGDQVAFSAGGTGSAAVLSAAGASLRLWWPGVLPAPQVSGSSATYRGVLPGVDLVLTATSSQAGGFSDVLVVRSAAAAADPRLAALAWRVAVSGGRLGPAVGGGLAAVLPGRRGTFAAAAPVMWDSSLAPAGRQAVRGAVAAARAVGAGLAPMGSGQVSSSAGPGGGARVAPVGAVVTGAGTRLRLVPDQRLLTSPSTRFPVYIDPSFIFVTATGDKQAYDPVQSGSGCTSSHYNSGSYDFSPMGYDNFQAGSCQFNDTDYALYRIGIPSAVTASDANLISASVQLTEVYTSSCGTSPSVTVSWIGGIGSGTGWPGPNRTANNVDSTKAFGPDSGSCNTIEDTGSRVSQGFSIMGDMSSIGSASNITLRVWEKSDTNDADHKQLTNNPTIQFTYNDTPSVPYGLKEAATSQGGSSIACDTNASDPNLPRIGKTDSTNGPFLIGTYGDPDEDTVKGIVEYWNNATPSTTFTLSAGSSLSGSGSAQIPPSFTSMMTNGTVVGWKAQAQDGSSGGNGPFTSNWSSKCYFAVYPQAPDPPSMTTTWNQTVNQQVGTPLTVTFTQSAGDTAQEFVWSLDKTPPTTGTIPAGQTCTTSSATSPNCVLSGGSASLTITVPSPGPHDLWVYEKDAGGNVSVASNNAPAGFAATFSAAVDSPPVPFTSGANLAANFTAALGAGKSYDSTMISSSAGASCGAATGDGTGTDLAAGDLTSAGWVAGKTVTLDGTSFTLPSFGSCGVDNLLAASQTIGAGSSGAQGNALVFLAASSMGFASVPGLVTGSSDSIASDVTAPAVIGNTAVTGSGCTGAVASDTTLQGQCLPASGSISYMTGPGCPATQSYDLTVPDWWSGPSDIAAVTLPHVVKTGGQQNQTVKIYAFSVPLNGSCKVASVTLPDVSNAVSTAVTSGSTGISLAQPGLHVFAVSVRNTTTATPEALGAEPSSPSGQGWTGGFESPVENAFGPPAGITWGNQTMRIWAGPNVSAPAGALVRIRLSDPGFLSADGTGPLQIGAVTIAQQYLGAEPAQPPVALMFGGSTSVIVPEGGDIYSDPLTLPFAVTAGKALMISVWVENTSLPVLPVNSTGSGGGAWFSPSSTPNETGDATGTPFTGTGSSWIGAVPLLTGVDVTTPAVTLQGTANPGAPTVVIAGNSIVDGWTASEPSDTLNVPSERLAGQLASLGLAPGFGVTDAGVEANQILADGGFTGGVSLIARIDRDVLAEPDVGTVVISQGLEDLLVQAGATTSGPDEENALAALVKQLNAFGVTVIVGLLTPCSGYANATAGHTCTTGTGATVDAARTGVNSVLSGVSAPNCWADFDSAVSDGGSPEALAKSPVSFDSSDHANLSFAGYAALAPAVSGSGGFCTLMPSMFPLPAVP